MAALLGGSMLAAAATSATAATGDSVYSDLPVKTWVPTGGQVYAMARVGDKIILGGSFTALKPPTGPSVARARLARIDAATGALDLTWNPGADGNIRALATDGARIYAGGNFTTIGGVAKARFAALDAFTGATVPTFSAESNGEVRSLLIANGRIYAGGLFTVVNGVQRVRLMSVLPSTGVLDNAWKPQASWAVNSIAQVPGTTSLALGGEFSVLSTLPRKYLATVNQSTGAVQPWAPAPDCVDPANPCIVKSIVATPTLVYAAVSGVGGRVSAYDTVTGVRKWSQYGDGDVQVVVKSGDVVYGGGHYDPIFGQTAGVNQTRYELAAMDATTGKLQPYAPKVQGGTGIWAMLADSDGLRIGGAFTSVNGDITTKNYAQFPLAPLTLGVTVTIG